MKLKPWELEPYVPYVQEKPKQRSCLGVSRRCLKTVVGIRGARLCAECREDIDREENPYKYGLLGMGRGRNRGRNSNP